MNALLASEVLKSNTHQAMVIDFFLFIAFTLSFVLNLLYFESSGDSMNWKPQFLYIYKESRISSGCVRVIFN